MPRQVYTELYPREYWKGLPPQRYLNSDPEGGNCWAACIAAILKLTQDDVPHFYHEGKAKQLGFYQYTQAWLNERGLAMVKATPAFYVLDAYPADTKPVPVIQTGPSARSKGMGEHHAVVSVSGMLVYDPHPEGTGLTAVVEEYLITKLDLT